MNTLLIVQEIIDRRNQLVSAGVPEGAATRIANDVVMNKLHREFEAKYYCRQDAPVECDDSKALKLYDQHLINGQPARSWNLTDDGPKVGA